MRHFVLILLLGAAWGASAQGLALLASPTGSPLTVTAGAAGFPAVLSGQGSVQFDAAVLDLDSITLGGWPSMNVSAGTPGSVAFSWFDPALTGATPPATLFTLHFSWADSTALTTPVVFASTPTPMEWIGLGFTEITPVLGAAAVAESGWTPTDGGGGSDPDAVAFAIDSVEVVPGEPLVLALTAEGFDGVLGWQGSLAFPAGLTPVAVEGLTGVQWSPSPGGLSFSWFAADLQPVTVPDGEAVLTVSCAVDATGALPIAWSDVPVVREVIGASGAVVPATYGGVELAVAAAPTPQAVLDWGEVAGAPGEAIHLPLYATLSDPVAAAQMSWSLPGLTILSITSPSLPGFGSSNWSMVGEVVTAVWYDASLAGVSGDSLVLLEVTATTEVEGSYPTEWQGAAEMATSAGTLFDVQQAEGAIGVATPTAAFHLAGDWEAGTLTVDVVATQPVNALSFQSALAFDPAELQFTAVSAGGLTGFSAANAVESEPGTLAMSWFDATLNGVELDLDQTAFTLTFEVVGSSDSTTLELGVPALPYEVIGPGLVPYEVAPSAATFAIQPGACSADLDGDCTVDLRDLLQFLTYFGCVGDCPGDFNGDGIVSLTDFMVLLSGFGTEGCCG